MLLFTELDPPGNNQAGQNMSGKAVSGKAVPVNDCMDARRVESTRVVSFVVNSRRLDKDIGAGQFLMIWSLFLR
ncbi:MAG: hypothetical protein AB8B64_02815 [Granulosicoccus sp.]